MSAGQQMAEWSNRFVGIPYAEFGRDRLGCDCWGLACVIYREELGITLPDYLGQGAAGEHAEIAALVAGESASPLWVPAEGTALAFDLAVFRRGRFQSHVGIVIRHGLMLHLAAGDCAKVERFDHGRWKTRHAATWRHVELIGLAR